MTDITANITAAPDLLSGDSDNQKSNDAPNNQSARVLPSSPGQDENKRVAFDGTAASSYHRMENGQNNGPHSGPSPRNDNDDIDNCSTYSMISVLTADEISDPRGFCIVCLIILIGDMSRGIMFPTLWPLTKKLGGTEVAQGYVVSAFSFGRILVSPLFGSWSVTHGYKKTLTFSLSILTLGTLLYAQAQNVGRVDFLIFAQTVLGVGSGTLGVTRAFVAEVTPTRNRTTYMAWLTAMQYAGFTGTPLLGAVLLKIFGDDDENGNGASLFSLDGYNSPAYFMTIMCIITITLLNTMFIDRVREKAAKKKKSSKRMEIEAIANERSWFGLTVYDATILGLLVLNVATKGSIASFETLGITIAEIQFNMYSSSAGFIVGTCGVCGVAALLSMGHLSKFMTDVQMIAGGMFVSSVGIMSLIDMKEGQDNPSWRFIFAIFLIYSIGYPIGHTAVIGLFSKVVGRRPQGTLLGWFASAGSLSRMFFPIMSGYVAHHLGTSVLFIILAIVLVLSAIGVSLKADLLEILSR